MFYYHANKTHFHKKGFALALVLRVRVFGTWKWPILFSLISIVFLVGEFLRTGISYKTLVSLGRDVRRHYLKVGQYRPQSLNFHKLSLLNFSLQCKDIGRKGGVENKDVYQLQRNLS